MDVILGFNWYEAIKMYSVVGILYISRIHTKPIVVSAVSGYPTGFV